MQAFEGFKQAVHAQRQLSGVLRSVAARVRSQNVAAAFASWGELVVLRRSQKAAAEEHYHSQLLSRTCNAWAECVAVELLDREHKLSGFLTSHQTTRSDCLKRDTFTTWRQAVACGGITESQQQLMNQCMNRMHRRHIRGVFGAWRVAADARYERMRRLLVLRSKLVKSSALQCWCAAFYSLQ